ncbi:kunitz-type protease inhibitor 2-like [Anopheles maculipalpis]|uniref:kunitz-type protease inhibitor 2-like n=1 Tax=Anopheles maculipalpis TaxID=1496333 RepID=UPI002159A22B|nr:kunitz-type protease inhibitor 2-like [Anopheles maculipalpis]
MMCCKRNSPRTVPITMASILLLGGVALLCLLPTPTTAQPIDMLDQIGSESRRMFYKMLEYLGDYDELEDDGPREREEKVGSLPLQTSNRVEVAAGGRDEQCKLPPRRGVCRALLPRYRYDPAQQECIEFKFGGCDGNANNFMSYKQCMEACKGV